MSSPFTGSLYDDWQIIAMAAAAISVIGSSMLIMFSRLFTLKNLEQIAKTEFIFAASTVFIVIMVVGLIEYGEPLLAGGSSSLARCLYLSTFQLPCDDSTATLYFPNQNTLIDWMKLYMATPAGCVDDFMHALYALSIPVEAFASVYMEIFMSEHASGFGVKWIAERIKNTTQSLSFYMYIYYLLIHVFNFIKFYGGFFFSIGVALRAFPPTRGAGAYLMAASFGFYFVFPLAYVLIATMSMPHAQSSLIQLTDPQNPVPDPQGGVETTCMLPQAPDIEQYACEGASAANAFQLSDRIKDNSVVLEDLLNFRLTDFTRHLVSSICLFPLIAFVVFFTFVLNFTNLFGGNIPEIGRGLVKLI